MNHIVLFNRQGEYRLTCLFVHANALDPEAPRPYATPRSTMDHSALSAGIFDKFADIYRDKYMELTTYAHTYREFCELLPPGPARVLDAACGPGNVARFLMAQKPDLDLLGIDLAPHMIELARNAVPVARFAVHDCRDLPL